LKGGAFVSAVRSLLLALLIVTPALARPGDTPLDLRDVEISVHVRQALMHDPEVGPLNLGVSVLYNQATLWGRVPSRELADRALRIVEDVRGVYQVKDDLRVAGNEKELALRQLAIGLAGGGVDPDLLLSEREEDRQEVSVPDPAQPRPQQVTTAQPDPKAWESQERGPAVMLLPPVPVILPTARTPDVILPAPKEDADPDAASSTELAAMVEHVRAADPRFADVRAEISNGRVTLSGSVASAEDLIELGRMLSQLPGVRNVDLRGVRTSR
jgi:osmotically-inducible protein OsmY